MKTISNIILSIFIVVILACGSNNRNEKRNNNQTSKAPDFILQTLEGKDYYAQEIKGKVVVVDFWATWCQPCIKEIPSYNALFKKYKDKNFRMIGITVDSGPAENVKPFIKKFKIEYPIYMGDDKVKADFGGIRGYPTTFVIDQNWNIYKKYLGMRPGKVEEIDKIVSELLNHG